MDIKTFKAVRPSEKHVEEFVCPPYDVLTKDQVAAMTHNRSLLQVTRPDGNEENARLNNLELHELGRRKLDEFIQEGILIQEEGPALYLYEEETGDHCQRGVVGIFDSQDYLHGKIARHELTLAEKEADRTLHFKTLKTQTEPVFLFARDLNLRDLKGEKLYELTREDGVTHRLYRLTEP